MKEPLFYASQELKRAEHLLYVSLKYTRTADVMQSFIARLVSCFDFIIDGLLVIKEKSGDIFEIPPTPFGKVKEIKRIYSNNIKMIIYMEFYLLLRKMMRSKFSADKEFRRHLNMIMNIDGRDIMLTIDILTDYYHQTYDFLRFIKKTHILENQTE
jgi:hypothetical protein